MKPELFAIQAPASQPASQPNPADVYLGQGTLHQPTSDAGAGAGGAACRARSVCSGREEHRSRRARVARTPVGNCAAQQALGEMLQWVLPCYLGGGYT